MSFIQPMFHLRLKPRPPIVGGLGHQRPRGGFLRDHQHVGVAARRPSAFSFRRKSTGLQVFLAAVDVGRPLVRLAGHSPDTAWRPPRPPAGRRCGTSSSQNRAEERRKLAHLGAVRSQRRGCPSRRAPASGGRYTRSSRCRRIHTGPARPCRSGRGPSPESPAMPLACMWSTNHMKSSGVPKREVGAK